MSKPIEDPPSLVDLLAREHAARRALFEAEAAHVIGTSDTHAPGTGEIAMPADTHVDVHADTHVDDNEIVAPAARASSPRILVEELTRKCCERRAALDDEARRS